MRDYIKREACITSDFSCYLFKSLLRNSYINEFTKFTSQLKVTKLHHFRNISNQRARCFITGRSYGIVRFAKLSRLNFRYLSGCGYFRGVCKRGH